MKKFIVILLMSIGFSSAAFSQEVAMEMVQGLMVAMPSADQFSKIRKEAENGNAHSQLQLALMYANGVGVKEDENQYDKWLLKSAEGGDAQAQALYGFDQTRITGQEGKDRAVPWFRKAAEQGNAFGQFYLGMSYSYGAGGLVPQNGEDIFWYRKAADQGIKTAQANVKYLCKENDGKNPRFSACPPPKVYSADSPIILGTWEAGMSVFHISMINNAIQITDESPRGDHLEISNVKWDGKTLEVDFFYPPKQYHSHFRLNIVDEDTLSGRNPDGSPEIWRRIE